MFRERADRFRAMREAKEAKKREEEEIERDRRVTATGFYFNPEA